MAKRKPIYIYKDELVLDEFLQRMGIDVSREDKLIQNEKVRQFKYMQFDSAMRKAEWGSYNPKSHHWIKFSDEQYSGHDIDLLLTYYTYESKIKAHSKIDMLIEENERLRRGNNQLRKNNKDQKRQVALVNNEVEELRITAQERKQTIDALSAEKGKLLRKLGRS